MFEKLDEAQLLALIEGELDSQEAESLRQRLADDPEALAVIERMIDDRVLLRCSEVPDLPRDILAELEPQMARPMLVGPSPAELRRRYRRPPRRWRRYAMAAAVVAVGILAGVWATINGIFSTGVQPGIHPPMHAESSSNAQLPPDLRRRPETDKLVLARDDDRGSRPPPSAANGFAKPPSSAIGDAPSTRIPVGGEGPVEPPKTGDNAGQGADEILLAADFALVLQAGDLTSAQETLQQLVTELGPRAALVRNFSYEEARRLEQEWLLSRVRRPGTDPAEVTASIDGRNDAIARQRNLRELADRARRQLVVRQRNRPDTDAPLSEQLYGPKELAPSLEQQLEFSDRGAAYTISVPASQLSRVLARLQVDQRHSTFLQMLRNVDRKSSGGPGESPLRWLRDYPHVLAAARRLQDRRDGVILLPIVIQQPRAR
ncbi:MAG: hypothetical protein O6758_03725 [Planctomycetota bacterium]|nr:hypothetical protein [Planctomycetota bacterium]